MSWEDDLVEIRQLSDDIEKQITEIERDVEAFLLPTIIATTLEKKLSREKTAHERSLAKLANAAFVTRAPTEVVEEVRNRVSESAMRIEKWQRALAEIRNV